MKIATIGCFTASMLLGSLTLTSAVLAEGLPITPGLWEIKTQNSTLGQEEVEQSCLQESVFDPVSMMGEEEGCDVLNEQIAGNTVDYDIACIDDEARGKAEGHFSFTIEGEQGTGQVDLTMSMGDQSMSMQYNVDAKRIGDC